MTAYKPCPFCGSTNIHIYIPTVYEPGEDSEVSCYDCDASIRCDTAELALLKWNTRAKMKEDTSDAVNLPYHFDTRDSTEYAVSDAVDHPKHYGGIENVFETINVIEAWGLDFSLGNAVKYISRAGKKDPTKEAEDLKKAVWYLERKIHQLEGIHQPEVEE